MDRLFCGHDEVIPRSRESAASSVRTWGGTGRSDRNGQQQQQQHFPPKIKTPTCGYILDTAVVERVAIGREWGEISIDRPNWLTFHKISALTG